MKKTIIITLLSLTIFSNLCGFKLLSTDYQKKGIIVSVFRPDEEHENGLVIFMDKKGDLWEFEGSEDWIEGDLLTVTMNDNGTTFTNKDDIITYDEDGYINATYDGYISKSLNTRTNIKDYL